MIIRNLFLFLVFVISFQVGAKESSVKNLGDLLDLIQKEKIDQSLEFQKRESRFKRNKSQRAQLLNQAELELFKEENISRALQASYNKSEKEIADLQGELQIIAGNLGELFGVVRQVAGDLRGVVSSSVTSAHIKGRSDFLDKMADSKKLPNIEQLRNLWLQLQLEATELGYVKKFKANVILNNGDEVLRDVVRIGAFNLVSDGRYLSFKSETGQILELPKQPSSRFLSYIEDLESAESGYLPMAIDPARGALLTVLLQVPSLKDRIDQGGFVGYIILLLFALGLGLGGFRLILLSKEKKILNQQLESEIADAGNPIGRLRLAFEKHQLLDIETIELKLEEIVVHSVYVYEKGISLIKILASVAPLLGLLGTVIGMIQTFQSITLFGTGDPKIMAGGISQALITTCLGLISAIPLLFLHSFISSKSKDLIQIVEEQLAGLIAKKTKNN